MAKIFQIQTIKARITRKALAARFLSYDIKLADPMDLRKALGLADNLALYSGSPIVVAQRREGVIRFDFQLPSDSWQSITRSNVQGMELGLAAGRIPVSFNDSEYHALFAGATKSGKSTAIQSLLCAVATEYDPSEVDIYIVDPHGDYDPFSNMAHLGAPVACEREEIAKTIQHVSSIYNERKANKSRHEKQIWFIIDEAQDDQCLGTKESGHTDEMELISALAKGSGKFNIRLVIGSQKPTQADLPGTLDNLGTRYVGKVSKAGTSAHLTGQKGLNAQLLSGSGDFLSVATGDVTRFQVALPTEQHFNALPRGDVPLLVWTAKPHGEEPIVVSSGRPLEAVEPETLAYYMTKYVSIGDAKTELGIGRTVHNRYKFFADRLKDAMEGINDEVIT